MPCCRFKNYFFLVCPIWLPVFLSFFYNEPELGVGIDPGVALTPLPSSIGRGLNPRPSDHEPSALPLDHGFHPFTRKAYFYCSNMVDY
jgi:hypothetical protein